MSSRYGLAPWDRYTMVVTIGTVILFAATSYYLANVFISLLLVILVFATYLFAPRWYTVTSQSVEITRLIGSIRIPRREIKSIELTDKVDVGIRLCASGGMFGYFGLFSLKSGGTAHVYSTRWDRMIVIKTADKTYIITPANAEGFYKAAMEKQ